MNRKIMTRKKVHSRIKRVMFLLLFFQSIVLMPFIASSNSWNIDPQESVRIFVDQDNRMPLLVNDVPPDTEMRTSALTVEHSITTDKVNKKIVLPLSRGKILTLDAKPKTVLLVDPTIADVRIQDEKHIFLYGKKPGVTELYLMDASGKKTFSADLTVQYDLESINRAVKELLPDRQLNFSAHGASLAVEGHVANQKEKDIVDKTLGVFSVDEKSLIDRIKVDTPNMVRLKVQVLELRRSAIESMNVNWSSIFNKDSLTFSLLHGTALLPVTKTGSGSSTKWGQLTQKGLGVNANSEHGNLSALIDFLIQDNIATEITAPVLAAYNGKVARFHAGGSFPFPNGVGTGGGITFNYQPIGISLEFTPEIMSPWLVRMDIDTSVSSTGTANISYGGTSIPSLTSRTTATTVTLSNGESLVISGLFEESMKDSLDRLPLLGEIPIIGEIFRSSSFQKGRSEVIIIVTPEIIMTKENETMTAGIPVLRRATPFEAYAARMQGGGERSDLVRTSTSVGFSL